MKGGSLLRRLLLAFAACFAALAAGLLLVLVAFYEPRYFGVESASSNLALALGRDAGGRLTVNDDGWFRSVQRRSSGLWWVVRAENGALISGGSPPEPDRRLLLALPPPQSSGEDILNYVSVDGRPATVRWEQTDAGPVTLALGGVSTAEMPLAEWLVLSLALAVSALIPLLMLFLLMGAIVLPLVLRALRRLRIAVAAVDGTDLDRRLHEPELVSELRPVARAFNAALERVQAVAGRRDRLVADIAHELRTPLAVLSLRAEELPDSPAKPELRRGLDRLSRMISQILDSERLGAPGRTHEPVDLVELARGAVAGIAPLAISEGYELEFEAEVEAVVVQGDAAAIGRAVANLLSNAVAHAGGGGTISVHVTAAGAVEVQDGGPGLPPGADERVFEPFHRERWDKDGCGLGLHLVQEVMRAHGGRAEAAPSSAGALFRLVFPGPAPAGAR
jgi:signal transduction histidine kinase